MGFLTWSNLDTAPQYSAAITSMSGLDPATDLGRATLDLEFNLTIRVAATSPVSGACLEVGTALDVSYQGVRLAGAPVPRLCAGPKHAAEARRVAWGAAVRVPRFVLDGLAKDLMNGDAAFDVTIALPPKASSEGRRQLVQCMARRVGDDGALQAPCLVTEVDTSVNTSG
ncbi:hypothetical protein EJB05_20757, partial [Eragrostis curvula]